MYKPLCLVVVCFPNNIIICALADHGLCDFIFWTQFFSVLVNKTINDGLQSTLNLGSILQLVLLEHYPNAYSDHKTLIGKPKGKVQSMNL